MRQAQDESGSGGSQPQPQTGSPTDHTMRSTFGSLTCTQRTIRASPTLVVHHRCRQLFFGPEIGETLQPVFETVHKATLARIEGVMDLEEIARQIRPALTAIE